jgi:predicted nucleotide-binding protein
MASGAIPPGLIRALQKKLVLSRAAVYDRIQRAANRYQLDRRAAAVLLASQSGVNTTRFSTPEDRAAVREVIHGAAGNRATQPETQPAPAPPPKATRARVRAAARKPDTSVWVVHGRDLKAANELRKLLRAFGLNPLEFTQAIAQTRQGSPFVGGVLEKGIGGTGATVVLFTGDDEARLRKGLRSASDSEQERNLTPQPRLNVVFEAGMGFGHDARRTVLVQIGRIRPISNLAGRHIVHLDGSQQSRQELATKLRAAGCKVNQDGLDWMTHGEFDTKARRPKKRARGRKR